MGEQEIHYELRSFSDADVFRFYSTWRPGLYNGLGFEELGMKLPATNCLGCKA